eukprot:gene7484-13258_t
MEEGWNQAFKNILIEYIKAKVAAVHVCECNRNEVERNRPTKVNFNFYKSLLDEDEDSYHFRKIYLDSIYPKLPLFVTVCNEILKWIGSDACPFTTKVSMTLLDDEFSRERRELLFQKCKPTIDAIRTLMDNANKNTEVLESANEGTNLDYKAFSYADTKDKLFELLDILQERGILDLLGVRETPGSVVAPLPSFRNLLESFTSKHSVKSNLTVGARALSKHHHRCQSEWWGSCKGSESEKNDNALKVLEKIFKDCVWINIHSLPHDVHVIELRYDNENLVWLFLSILSGDASSERSATLLHQ